MVIYRYDITYCKYILVYMYAFALLPISRYAHFLSFLNLLYII